MKPTKSFAVAVAIIGVLFSMTDLVFAIEKSRPKVSAKESFRPNSLKKLAVIVSGPQKSTFLVRQPQSDHQRLVEDQFLGTLIEKNYDIAVRSDLEKILGEQQLQKSGLTDTDSAEIGRLLNVPAVMLIHITEVNAGAGRFGGGGRSNIAVNMANASLGARLIDVKTGSVLWTGTHRVELQVADQRSSDALIKAAAELAEAFPKRDATAQSPNSPQTGDPGQNQRLGGAFVAGSVWEGTHTQVEDEERSIDVKWIIKERDGEKFHAEIVMPLRTLQIEGSVSRGAITWRGKTQDGSDGKEQTLRLRGRTIMGKISRMRPDGKAIESTVLLRLKSE